MLNDLSYFHVCNPGLPPCAAHDLFEGCFSEDMKFIIDYFINLGVFSYDGLNIFLHKISKVLQLNIRFPIFTKDTKKIPGCAYENWYFIIVFPLFMETLSFDIESEVWKMFISILEIVRLVCSLEVSKEDIIYLAQAIEAFTFFRKLAFPNNSFKPKHHYLNHYPQLIEQFGPLGKVWTLRFENKHQFFKKIANRCKNHKNITKTLAHRHQLHQASLFNERFPAEISSNNALSYEQDIFNITLPIKCSFISKSIEIRGISYHSENCIVSKINKYVDITVLKIISIFFDHAYANILFYRNYIKMIYNYKSGLYESSSKFERNDAI